MKEWYEMEFLEREFQKLLELVSSFRTKPTRTCSRLARERGLSEDQGSSLATIVVEGLSLHVGRSTQDWVEAYDACRSCMWGKGAAVKAAYTCLGDDFAVATLKRGTGEITARAVINSGKAEYSGAVYGVGEYLLKSALAFLGIKVSPKTWADLSGLDPKLFSQYVKQDSVWVYIDGPDRSIPVSRPKFTVPKTHTVRNRKNWFCPILRAGSVTIETANNEGWSSHTEVRYFIPCGETYMPWRIDMPGLISRLLMNSPELYGLSYVVPRELVEKMVLPGWKQPRLEAAVERLLFSQACLRK